jgi:predicted transcriptional regulator
MGFMKQLIIKIGGDVNADIRACATNKTILRTGTRTIYVKDADEARSLLSPERINLLKHSLECNPSACVSDLVKSTKRKQEAISRDLTHLESMGAIKKIKKGRHVFIEPQIDSIEIKFK